MQPGLFSTGVMITLTVIENLETVSLIIFF